MELKKLGFINIKREDILSRNEMRGVLAGSGMTCCEFLEQTGCYPSQDPNDRCRGNNGRMYNAASSSGSCGTGC